MRTPPKFIEGERAILGGILLDNEALSVAAATLKPTDFAAEPNRVTYAAALHLFETDKAVDLVTLTSELKRCSKLEHVGGPEYLMALQDAVPSIANIKHYVDMVKEKALRRRTISAAREMADIAYDDALSIDEALDAAEEKVFGIAEERISTGWTDMTSLMLSTVNMVDQLYDRKQAITGIASGFSDLDELTAGFQPSDLIIIAGRPGMGKTAFALNVAQNAAMLDKVPTAFFSLEMSKEQLGLRMLCSTAHVNGHSVRRGFITDSDYGAITTAVGAISEMPLYVGDEAALSPLQVRAMARRLKREGGLGLVVIDYLQLMKPAHRSDSREREISEISRSLKALAKELNIPVIALSQLNRKVEDRADKRPQLADLRESGAIEQDADVVLFVYRDDVYNKSEDNPKKGIAEIIIGKQRNGPVGTVELTWKENWSAFLPMSKREE